jgi:hypothetical protein
MIEKEQIQQLRYMLKRVYALPITQSTYKEVQTTIYNVCNQSTESANRVLEALLRAQAPTGQGDEQGITLLIEEFSVPTRLSKDILEKGEFINFMSSDLLQQGNRALFINHIRRVDGKHFQFFSEPEGILRLLEHFTGRLEEIKQADPSKNFLESHATEIAALNKRFSDLAS